MSSAVAARAAARMAALGYDNVKSLNRDDLVALTPEAAAITRLPYRPDLRERRSLGEAV